MKTKIRMTIWTIAAMGAWLPLALAQNPPEQPPKPPTAKPQSPGPKTVHPEPQGLKLFVSDRLVGMDLYDATGTRTGTIEEAVLRPNGGIAYVVVRATVDGQTKLYPVPWSALKFESGGTDTITGMPGKGERLVITFDKDRFKTAPSFSMEQWPTEDKMTVFTEADTFYRTAPGETVRPGDVVTMAPTLRLTRLRNIRVTDATGKPIGSLGLVAIDPMGGRLNYATMTLAEGPGSGRVIAIPWEAIRVSREGEKDLFLLSVPTDRLNAAPQFQTGEESWKQMSDPDWVGQMYSYYSIRPYWSYAPSKAPGEGLRPPGN